MDLPTVKQSLNAIIWLAAGGDGGIGFIKLRPLLEDLEASTSPNAIEFLTCFKKVGGVFIHILGKDYDVNRL